MAEIWEDGSAFEELRRRRAALADARDSIEAARKVCAQGYFRSKYRVLVRSKQHCLSQNAERQIIRKTHS